MVKVKLSEKYGNEFLTTGNGYVFYRKDNKLGKAENVLDVDLNIFEVAALLQQGTLKLVDDREEKDNEVEKMKVEIENLKKQVEEKKAQEPVNKDLKEEKNIKKDILSKSIKENTPVDRIDSSLKIEEIDKKDLLNN